MCEEDELEDGDSSLVAVPRRKKLKGGRMHLKESSKSIRSGDDDYKDEWFNNNKSSLYLTIIINNKML